ncbi:GUN4 domain-containing protein [Nostoc sp. UIC 10607]|uniref:GUN4 domain-containing protein n=1 Tax=Nostoc sp. UIC 10607 TaxID=3045935 RepID=UPI00399FE93B
MKKLQQYLKLKDEDVALIDKEAEDQKQQGEILQQQQEAQRLQLQREQAEEGERLRQKKAQRLQRQREQEKADKLLLEQQSTDNDLLSEKGVDYTRLRDLLKAGNWKEADRETLAVMLKALACGWLSHESINNFPCTDLRTIDQLWEKYSNGHFGFSVQKRIWESVGKNYEKFGDRVGWSVKGRLSFTISQDIIRFPYGHLPGGWGGLKDRQGRLLLPEWVFSSVASRLINCNI